MKTRNEGAKALVWGTLILLFTFAPINWVIAQTCVQPPADLVSWWPGDGNVNDIIDGNHGTLQNGATFAPGFVGQAFSFDGVDDFVRVPNAPNLEPQQLTIEAWVFPKSVGSIGTCCQDAEGPIIISKDTTGTAAGSGVSYGILGPGTTGQFSAHVRFTDGTQPFFFSTNAFGLNTWHHVAMTWDGNTIRLYVNATLEGFSVVGPKTVAYSPQDLSIGRHSIFGGHRPFDGLIDEPAIYNRALSAAEIQVIFAAGSAGKCKDEDGDGISDDDDNCPNIPNPDQINSDTDSDGDACDDDDDNDTVLDAADNCPLVANHDQSDRDRDGAGDLCDTDADGDGVLDAKDACLATLPGEVVDDTGCSIDDLCPCENAWKNHGAYVSCVAHAAEDFVADGLITEAEKDAIVAEAAASNCGQKP